MIGYVALGSNIGNRVTNLITARDCLNIDEEICVLSYSRLYKTAPYGYTNQPEFLNAVLKIETSYSGEELLTVTQGIEKKMGREKLIHWGPRLIDIDILLLGKGTIISEQLTIPHIELTKRSFVLVPLKDVYGEKLLFGKSLTKWIQDSGNQNEVQLTNMEEWTCH
ncbi:2-amino-4-hydroxy-6-hydroxymethyldihydropteridine diphosphokinase [Carnobacterium gallinarum]|uniref:2-amino-4-hydroxy-6- hydroxymethyldihydropteridine diphosphokinase n=1 Tax=Carnobacterium gallinarum TaxID=2749 RepID=UPI00054D810B|nr:2-amino-4-hydroxy-6-hydroxymethyldihydropteridine diphosphokinase [Carnobacterium gallinarum]